MSNLPLSRWKRDNPGGGDRRRRTVVKGVAAAAVLTVGILATTQLADAGTLSSHQKSQHAQKQQKTHHGKTQTKAQARSQKSGGTSASYASPASSPKLATGDTRHVTEPQAPSKVCATLTANVVGGSLPTTASDTSRIQHALDSCQTGSGQVAVELKGNGKDNAFLSGALTVHQGEVLLIDSGITLYGSRNPADYQSSKSGVPRCGTTASKEGGCNPLIKVSGANAGVEGVRAANGSQGRIDGQGGQTMTGKGESWWQLAQDALKANNKQNAPRMIEAGADNFTLHDIDLLNSPNFHVSFKNATGFTAWGVRILTPSNARNTDGIDPAGAHNVTIADSYISTGDDCVAVKAGAPSGDITIENTHCYHTHGISIGSETNGGLTNVLVLNDTIDGTGAADSANNNGIRIKSSPSNGGTVTDVSYHDICVRGAEHPLDFDSNYNGGGGQGSAAANASIPSFTGITVDRLKSDGSPSGATSVFDGYDAAHPLGVTLSNVWLDTSSSSAQYARITLDTTNVSPSGKGVTVSGSPSTGSDHTTPTGLSCSFPAFPAL